MTKPSRTLGPVARVLKTGDRKALIFSGFALVMLAGVISLVSSSALRPSQKPDPTLHLVHLVSQDDADRPWVFDPMAIQIRPGTRVRWINHEKASTTTTASPTLSSCSGLS